MKSLKRSLFSSIIALVLCVSMLLGTTLAWFTDSVISSDNKIVAGNLDVEMYWSDTYLDADASGWQNADGVPVFTYDKWEPGYSEIKYIKVKNAGNLSLKWRLSIVAQGTVGELSDVIDVYFINPVNGTVAALENETSTGKLTDVLKNNLYTSGVLLPEGVTDTGYTTEETVLAIAFHMDDEAGNEYKGKSIGDGFALRLLATQFNYENDSFGNGYDENAKWPENVIVGANTASVNVTAAPDGTLASLSTMASKNGSVNASVPAGVLLAQNTDRLTLTVKDVAKSDANITLDKTEASLSIDVHIDGVSPDNTVPIAVGVKELLPVGLNLGNFRLYHVENGATVAMTRIEYDSEIAHNTFKYDPATGDVTLYLKSFSEVALVADTENAWEGKFDYTWYDDSKTELTIANADQLAAFSAIVGGMNGQAQDDFSGKIVKLLADINLGDKESENNEDIIFYPIGYWNNEGTYDRKPLDERTTAVESGLYSFCGIFDGNGHTIANFYHNTWEMKGDHNWYDPVKEQYYRDGMGLFGKVYGGTVKNLTVKNFSSDGEIATTGVIAAYADGATFENIAIFNCNPRVYNIGNGGIVGCVGWYAKEANLKTTFKNITVDNSNKISALWGSYDVACGGIVGQYYPTSGQSSAGAPVNGGISFENCHISAQMDVYNDVCGNYQYYAYRYAGMLIGSVRENVTINGHSYPKMDGITAADCTVHFGTWNDYYYCEIIDNTTASYTHDYQMSRLTEIKAIDGTTITYLDGTTGTVPASGRANYVIVDYTKGHGTENATCYHFKDGAVWTHDMGGIQTGIDENGDGKDDLKEDKQHIYLEFNNLVTGHGWGVTSRGFSNLDGVKNLDIEQGDHEESVNKFNPSIQHGSEFATESTVTIGDLFAAIENAGVDIKSDNVQVTVSPFGTTSTAGGTYVANTTDWTQGTLTFSGVGQAVISITDYYFCKNTTITVNIIAADKFDTNFVNYKDYLYRVGNKNIVTLGTIFKKLNDTVTIDSATVNIEVENIVGTANGTYTSNATWTDGTLQFTGTGVVKVTISADGANSVELELEVVDAENATSATSATKNNVVLLSNCGFSSLEVSGGYTLYGNGFTMTCGSDSAALDMGYAFVTLNNGTLDNVQIVCPNFDYAVLYKSNMTESGNRSETTDRTRYYNVKSGVMVSGNSQILNSRISGARAAVNVTGGNCLIDNSRVEGGAVASILVGSANSLVLRDVTLVQKPTASTYDSSKTLMGFSVLVMCTAGGNAAPITLEGTLVQNAWVDEEDATYVPEAAKTIIETVMEKEEYLHDLDGDGTKESLNLGIAYMPADEEYTVNKPSIVDDRTNKSEIQYDSVDVKYSLVTTYVYSYKNTNGTADSFKTESKYTPNKQGDIITVTYNDTINGLESGKSFGTAGWVYELNVDLDKASGYKLDFSKLTMVVNGVPVTDYKVNGNAKPTSPVAVTAGGVTYTLTATVNGKEYTATYKVTGTETSKESPSKISGPTAAGFGVAGSYGGDWSGAADVLTGVKVKYWSVAEKKYVEYDFSSFTVPGSAGKLNGANSYWEYTHTNNDFTLKVTNTVAIHSGKSVYGMPIRGTDGKLYFTISSTNGYVGSGTTSRAVTMQYEFTDNNGGEKLTFTHTFNINYDKANQYNYSDLCDNGKLTKLKSCVTPDTLVTLADGTQKRIDQVTYDDQLLVWNFYTGEYAKVPAAIIFDHGYGNNTVIRLNFSDGTTVKVVNLHQFFDADLKQLVSIDAKSVADYVGHEFVKMTDDGYTTVTLVDYAVSEEYVEAWGIISAMHYNIFVEGMLSADFMYEDYDLFNYFVVGEDMVFDEEQMQSDIEKYGLYTYDDFADYLTYEQFVAFNVQYFKIVVGKGLYTYEGILALIDEYLRTPIA